MEKKKEKLLLKNFAFDPETTAFSWKNAHGCAMASILAYEPEDKITEWVEDAWESDLQFISGNGTQVFVMGMKKMILVAFRGTEPKQPEDLLTDLNLDLVDGPMRGQVHEGFYDGLSSVWRKVEMTIARFRQHEEKSLWFTGHSLGAGLATLAVAKLRDEDRAVDGLYTFGQPRTGNAEFARNFNFDFKPFAFRFVNNNDVVTRVPPRSLGYSHIGTFRYFDELGRFHADIGKWNRFLDRMRGRIQDLLEWGTDGLKDHGMENYLERVAKASPKKSKKS